MRIILASQSQIRKELLKQMGLEFEVIVSNADETFEEGLSLEEQSKRLAYIKAKTVFDETEGDRIVIGSDTMILKDNVVYGKPKDNTSISGRFILRKKYFDDLKQDTPGLLLIYPMNKDSEPMNKNGGRIPLKASEHVIGITLIFPKENRKELNQYMSIQLPEEQ